jgi:ankyrin repeat protein
MVDVPRIAGAAAVVLTAAIALPQNPAPAGNIDKADALSDAVRKGDAAIVKKLLDEGVDVNTKYRYDRTPLSFACDRGHLEVVKLLLERGADVNARDTFYGATPLTWAASPAMSRKPEHVEIVALLLKRGAQGKEEALESAIDAGDVAMSRVSLETGGLSAETLATALEAATTGKQAEIVALLEKGGAKPRVEVKLDENALARLAGTYRTAEGSEIVFSVADGRLTASTPSGDRFILAASSETTFGIIGSRVTVTFRIDQGKAASVAIGRSDNVTTFDRVEGK